MKRGRAAARARRRALAVALALAVAGAAVAPVAPGPANVARAQGGTGIIAHSSKGVLLRAEPDYGAEVLATVAEGTAVGLRTDVADTVYDPDGVTQWWPISADDADGWVAGFYLDIEGFRESPTAEPAADSLRGAGTGCCSRRRGRDRRKNSSWPPGIWQTRPLWLRNPTASISGRTQAPVARPSRRFPIRRSSSCASTRSTPSTPRGAAGGRCRSMVSLAGSPVSTWRRPSRPGRNRRSPRTRRFPRRRRKSPTGSRQGRMCSRTPTMDPDSISAPTAPRTPSGSASCRRTTSSRSWTGRTTTPSAIPGT